jgi:hypothetical protein
MGVSKSGSKISGSPSNGSRPNFAMKSFRASAIALFTCGFSIARARARYSFREIDIL